MFPQMALATSTEDGESEGDSNIGASSEPVTADVTIVSQKGGIFLTWPTEKVRVSSDLAENYGYTDSVEDGVSALDALVKAHEIIFGDKFTEGNKANYLVVNEYGYVTTIFGTETSANGFFLNEGYPNDGTISGYGGYNGTTVSTQKVENGDKLDFFIYQDTTYWSDNYSWIDGNLTVKPSETLNLTVKGASVMGGSTYATPEALKNSAQIIASVALAWVDENEKEKEKEKEKTLVEA